MQCKKQDKTYTKQFQFDQKKRENVFLYVYLCVCVCVCVHLYIHIRSYTCLLGNTLKRLTVFLSLVGLWLNLFIIYTFPNLLNFLQKVSIIFIIGGKNSS